MAREGGSYAIKNGKRELVERTQQAVVSGSVDKPTIRPVAKKAKAETKQEVTKDADEK